MARFLNLPGKQAINCLLPAHITKVSDTPVEVLRGNHSGSKHGRRRSDKLVIAENRVLDWGSHDTDITLFPHSPLALVDALSTSGGILDLVPSAPDDAAASTRAKSADRSEAQPRQRNRINLLTQHNEAELLDQCKKVLVQNALIKNKGDQQLYLAAGFISWSDTNDANQTHRAPVLLYPALLVRNQEGTGYEIRLSGEVTEFNIALQQHIEQRFDTRMPDYETNQSLAEFYAQLAQLTTQNTSLNFEFDVALGTAALSHIAMANRQKLTLPEVPEHFDVGLAMSITGNKSLPQLNALLQLIPDYAGMQSSVEEGANDSSTRSGVAQLRKYAARLAADGLDHVEFRQLSTLTVSIAKWNTSVKTALASNCVERVLGLPELSARELIKLSSIIELIDKAPASFEHIAHKDLAFENSTHLLRRAHHQAKLIEDELSGLQEHFVLDKIPAKSQLLSLMAELGGHAEQGPDLVDADYFNARRQFMEFSTDKPVNLTTEHRRLLSQLAKVLRFRELFVNNTEYRTALGPAYKGLRTDWDTLSQTSEYARELAEVLESETIAAQILTHWPAFRTAYSVELELLQNGAEACRRLLGTLGTRWQSQTAASLVLHAQLIASRLDEWNSNYGSVDNHADKTPAMVLSSFTGKSREDVEVETQVDETRIRINQQLQAGEISREQISDTLKWLQTASATATENDMDIESIVDHLQTA